MSHDHSLPEAKPDDATDVAVTPAHPLVLTLNTGKQRWLLQVIVDGNGEPRPRVSWIDRV